MHGSHQSGQSVCVAGLTLIGYWRSDNKPQWPDPVEFVDDTWDPYERKWVAAYLNRGAPTSIQPLGWSRCRFCGQSNGFAELTDGVYLWPDGLSHYVTDHG